MHHLQTKNCGYNLLNGKENTPVPKMVKPEDEELMGSKISTFMEQYKLRPPYFSN